MGRYVAARLLQLIPILIGISLLSFALMHAAGGDAVEALLEGQGIAVSEDVVMQRRHELGLDQPFLVQYGRWLEGLVHGDLGVSYVSGRNVSETLASKLPATILLTISSVIATLVLAIPLGVASATHKDGPIDYLIRVLSFVGNALPNFFVALLLILVFAIRLGWLPAISSTIGRRGVASLTAAGLVLPTATLALSMAAKYTRQIRACVLEELPAPYVTGARSRGVRERKILLRYVMRSVAVTLTTLLALSIGDLLGGTAVVETIFQLDGVGKLAVDAITMRDYPVIQAYVLWMATIYVVVNLVADIAQHCLDPRIRREGR